MPCHAGPPAARDSDGPVGAAVPVLDGRPAAPYRVLVLGLLQGLVHDRQLGAQPQDPVPAEGSDPSAGPLGLGWPSTASPRPGTLPGPSSPCTSAGS